MNLREFYNPRKVYDGYFETYFIRPFFHHYADFRGKESGRSLLLSLAAWAVVTLGLVGILMGQVGLLGPEVGFSCLSVGCWVWGALSVIPLVSLLARYFNGKPENEIKTRFLGIDTMLAVSCALFFVLGLLMMVTTLDSGSLDPNASVVDEPDTTSFHMEEITEEPIFTYQDEAAAAEEMSDSLSDMTEPDLVTPEESFDPTISHPEDEIVESADTTFTF